MATELINAKATGVHKAHAGEFLFRMATKPLIELLSKSLDIINIKIGAEPISDENQTAIVKFIIDQYPKLNIGEIIPAFDLALSKKLDCNPSIYGKQINCEYVGRILSAYCVYRKAELRKLEIESMKSKKIDPDIDKKNEAFRQEIEAEISERIKNKDLSKVAVYHFQYIQNKYKVFDNSDAIRAIEETIEQSRSDVIRDFASMSIQRQKQESKNHKRELEYLDTHPTTIRNAKIYLAKEWIISKI